MFQKMVQKLRQLIENLNYIVISIATGITIVISLVALFFFVKTKKTKPTNVIGNNTSSENDIKIGETKQQATDTNSKAKQQSTGVASPSTFAAADDLLRKINDKK